MSNTALYIGLIVIMFMRHATRLGATTPYASSYYCLGVIVKLARKYTDFAEKKSVSSMLTWMRRFRSDGSYCTGNARRSHQRLCPANDKWFAQQPQRTRFFWLALSCHERNEPDHMAIVIFRFSQYAQ